MADKIAGRNFPRAPRYATGPRREGGYDSEEYYRPNRELGNSMQRRPLQLDDQAMYDDSISSKKEDYDSGGYYGSKKI